MLFDYFDVETFYKDIINSIEDSKKDNKKIIKLQPGLTIIRHGRIVQAQEKKQ